MGTLGVIYEDIQCAFTVQPVIFSSVETIGKHLGGKLVTIFFSGVAILTMGPWGHVGPWRPENGGPCGPCGAMEAIDAI